MKSKEDALVQRIVKALTFPDSRPLALGPGDDAALLAPRAGYQTILTSDWFLAGTHFLPGKHPADSVGWKCLARAISDVAAMGGQPKCFLLNLALPGDAKAKSWSPRWLDKFLGGLRRASRRFECVLAGGDTTQRDQILINITVIGEVRANRAVLRSGAKPGELIYVSGKLGGAELGLQLLLKGRSARGGKNPFIQKHLYPPPRIALAQWLADRKLATSMMDLSDGLSTDLPRLCSASRVGAKIFEGKIPTVTLPREKNRHNVDVRSLALNGGDDYELLFTVRPSLARRLPAFKGIPLTCIGEITRQRHLVLVGLAGRSKTLAAGGWDPFRDSR
jgi:thiamine-monophosphate kinase